MERALDGILSSRKGPYGLIDFLLPTWRLVPAGCGNANSQEDSYLPMFVRQFLEVGSSFALMVSNFLELPSFSVILR
jgi:hypothetical protein